MARYVGACLLMRWQSSILVGGLWASLCLAAPPAAPSAESEVKAAVVLNLLQFVQWPQEKLARDWTLVLCAQETSSLAPAFVRYGGTRLRETVVQFRTIDRRLEHLAECQAVFVDGGDPYVLLRVAAASAKQPLLVVAEGDHVLQQGAGIGLALAGNRIVFDIDLAALRAAGFTVSSKLLRLARSVLE